MESTVGVTVWSARPSHRSSGADRALLAPTEVDRMRRLTRFEDRDRFATAWALTRTVLGERLDLDPGRLGFDRSCTLCGDAAHGKPRLVGSSVQFSLAHAADRVLLAVADDVDVGVDVEPADAAVADAADWVRHPSERAEGRDLVRLWVQKEAILKATGHGLVRPMHDLVVDPPPAGLVVVDVAVGERYVAAVAGVTNRAIRVTCVRS